MDPGPRRNTNDPPQTPRPSNAPVATAARGHEPVPTNAPWEWRKVGNEYVLWGAHGMRPIVLSVVRGKLCLRVDGVMRPFNPEHPDAKIIAAAREMLDALKALYPHCHENNMTADSDYERAWLKAEAAIAKAEGSSLG